ncbi:MAG: co-chaperone GroES [Gammaproteobacteria bacterium]
MPGIDLLENRLLVLPGKEDTTAGGIVIPTSAQQKSDTGEVKAAGQGKFNEKGERQPMSVKVGNKVIYSKYAGTEVKLDGEDYIIIREEDVMGILQ